MEQAIRHIHYTDVLSAVVFAHGATYQNSNPTSLTIQYKKAGKLYRQKNVPIPDRSRWKKYFEEICDGTLLELKRDNGEWKP